MRTKALSESTAITLGATCILVGAAVTAVIWVYGVVEAAQTPLIDRMSKVEARQEKGDREYNRNLSEIREDLAEIRGALGIARGPRRTHAGR